MNVTVVVPILNEEHTIEKLLDALVKQTLSPTEVILVDGGSTDKTIRKIKDWQKKEYEFELFIVESQGANIAKARNIGIEKAQTEIVALTDAGCVPKEDWLKKIVQPFIRFPEAEVVAGFYDPKPANWFEDVIADYTCVRERDFNPETFLPSSRSIAFKKEIWKKVEGYPEELNTCEDLIFAERLKRKAKHWKVVKEAQVIWNQPKSLGELSNKIFSYATGDLQANYERHVKKIHSAKWRILTLLFLALPCLFVPNIFIRLFGIGIVLLYILGSLGKRRQMLKYPLAWPTIPILQFSVDLALTQALVFHALSSRFH